MDEQVQASTIADLNEDKWSSKRVSPERHHQEEPNNELHTLTINDSGDDPISDLQAGILKTTQATRRIQKIYAELKDRFTQLEAQLDTEKRTNSKLLYCNQQLSDELSKTKNLHQQLKGDFETIKTEFDTSARSHETTLEELEENKALAHKARSDNHQLQRKVMEQEELIRSLQQQAKTNKHQNAQTSETLNAIKNIMQQLEMSQSRGQQNNQPLGETDNSFQAWLGKKKREEVY